MITFPFGFIAAAAAPTPDDVDLLLNNIPYANGAWSVVRKLNKNYTGNLIEIRRTSDNTYQDIGFDADGDLDTAAITTFVGANSAYVRTVYDQSGKGNNLYQGTIGKEPRIVNAGTLDTVNGKPAYYHEAGDSLSTTSTIGTSTNNTHFSVGQYPSSDTWNIGFHHLTTGWYFSCRTAGGGAAPQLSSGTPSYYKNGNQQTATQAALMTAFHTDAQTLLTVTDLDFSSGWGELTVGGYGGIETQPYWFQEFVLYDRNQVNLQTQIQTNIGTEYLGWSDYSLFSTEFDGVDDYVDCGATVTDLGITNKFTVSCWIKADTLVGSWEGICGCASSNSWNDGFAIYMNSSGQIGFWVNNYITNLAISSSLTISTGTWYHVLACYDATLGSNNMELFVDGVSVATDALTANVIDSSGVFRICDVNSINTNYYGMNGNIDDFAIWNTDKRADVATIYNSGVPADLTDLSPTAWWRMGDESGAPYLINKMAYSKYSIYFDGINDYVGTGTSIVDLGITDKFTFSFWIKLDSIANYDGVLGAVSDSNFDDGFGCYISTTGNVLRCFINDYSSGGLVESGTLTTGTWYHFLWCYDGTLGSNNIELFLDGSSVDTAAFTATVTSPSNILDLCRVSPTPGGGGTFYAFNGNLDEVAVWNTDKRADVATIYNSGTPNDISSLNPISYYKMGEGAIFPKIPNEMAYSKQSMNFDGVDDYVEAAIDGTATGAFGSGSSKEFTISFWLKNDSSVVQPVAFNWGDTAATATPYMLIWPEGAVIRYLMWTGAGVATFKTGTESFPTGVWGHIALSRTASDNTWRLYVNGVADTTEDDTGTTDSKEANAQNIYLGEGYYNPTLGNIDDFALFTTALSQSDITSIYNNGVPNDISSLSPYTYWKMGDGDYFPTITDSGSGGNDGTATNMTGVAIEFDTPNGWGTASNQTAPEMIQGDTPGGNGGTMTNMAQADIVQDAPT